MEKKRETDYFGKEKISILMVRFFIPCVLSLLVSLLLLAVFYPFGRPILMLFGASENTIGYALECQTRIIRTMVRRRIFD